jgi:hypothetical protein
MGVLRMTRFVPDESVNGMTTKTLIQSFLNTDFGPAIRFERTAGGPAESKEAALLRQ